MLSACTDFCGMNVWTSEASTWEWSDILAEYCHCSVKQWNCYSHGTQEIKWYCDFYSYIFFSSAKVWYGTAFQCSLEVLRHSSLSSITSEFLLQISFPCITSEPHLINLATVCTSDSGFNVLLYYISMYASIRLSMCVLFCIVIASECCWRRKILACCVWLEWSLIAHFSCLDMRVTCHLTVSTSRKLTTARTLSGQPFCTTTVPSGWDLLWYSTT